MKKKKKKSLARELASRGPRSPFIAVALGGFPSGGESWRRETLLMPRILFSTSPALYFGGARGRGNQGRGRISAWQFVVCVRGELFEGKKKKNDDDDAAFKRAPRSLEKSPKKKKKKLVGRAAPPVDYIFPLPEWAALVRRTQEDTLFSSLFSKQWTVTLYPSSLLRPSLGGFSPFLVLPPPLARCLATSEGVQ